MDTLIIFGAKYLILAPVIVTAYLLYRLDKTGRGRFLGTLVIGGLLTLVLAKIASDLYANPRPFIADGVKPLLTSSLDNGFPSDHTLLSAFLAFTCLFFSRKIGIGLLLVAVLIGTSRVLANVHHGIDIVGGFTVALIGASLGWLIMDFLVTKRRKAV